VEYECDIWQGIVLCRPYGARSALARLPTASAVGYALTRLRRYVPGSSVHAMRLQQVPLLIAIG
jgi:hypothetical protein